MGTATPATHKHRNLIDDLLDGALAIIAIVYYFFSDQMGFHLDDKTIALIATAGATLRGTVRRLLMHLWGEQLGLTEPAEDAQPSSVATESAASED